MFEPASSDSTIPPMLRRNPLIDPDERREHLLSPAARRESSRLVYDRFTDATLDLRH